MYNGTCVLTVVMIRSDGLRIDGKKWKVEYAIKADLKYFGWKWTESRSPSRSPSRFENAAVSSWKLGAVQLTSYDCSLYLLQVTLHCQVRQKQLIAVFVSFFNRKPIYVCTLEQPAARCQRTACSSGDHSVCVQCVLLGV